MLLDPDEICAEVTFVFLDVLARALSLVMRAVLTAAADVEPLYCDDGFAQWWRGAMYAIGSGDLEWVT